MHFKKLALSCYNQQDQKHFYTKTLGMPLKAESTKGFKIQAGATELHFRESADFRPYHFAFNISSFQEKEALAWLKERVGILPLEGEALVDFSNWNAWSIYFYDADKNIVEFIARRNLKLESEGPFGPQAIHEVSEIGMPVADVASAFQQINQKLGLPKFDGSFKRFGAIGGEHALFICIDKNQKKWIPTNAKAFSAPFRVELSIRENTFELDFRNQEITIMAY